MIRVEHLTKHYEVHEREPGFAAALRSVLHRRFRTVKAVDDISFAIPEGEIVGFLGPNGAGKTTTMKVLTGLLHPTSGKVEVGGFAPFEHKLEFKRRISLVMGQKSQLIWDIPAMETFLVNKAIYEIDGSRFKASLEHLVTLLDLEAVIHKPVRQLSLGERMKCELAAALLHGPDLLFLDEPTIGLDVNMQEAMREFIREYNRTYKATILLTSHYMGDVTALCDRVMVINRGKLLYDGGISRLIERYSPCKRIKLQLDKGGSAASFIEELERMLQEQGGGRIMNTDDFPYVELEVLRERVSSVSAALLSRYPIIDLTIEEPSMEAVIGQAFADTAGTSGEGDGSL